MRNLAAHETVTESLVSLHLIRRACVFFPHKNCCFSVFPLDRSHFFPFDGLSFVVFLTTESAILRSSIPCQSRNVINSFLIIPWCLFVNFYKRASPTLKKQNVPQTQNRLDVSACRHTELWAHIRNYVCIYSLDETALLDITRKYHQTGWASWESTSGLSNLQTCYCVCVGESFDSPLHIFFSPHLRRVPAGSAVAAQHVCTLCT